MTFEQAAATRQNDGAGEEGLMSDCQEQNNLDSDVSDLVISLSHAFPKPSVKGIPLIFLMPDHFGFYAREPKWELIDRKRIHFLVTFREA